MTIRLIIVDDHKFVREGLKMFLALYPEFEIVGEASNGVEAVELTRHTHPDVVVMDLIMPELDGVSAIVVLRNELPEVEIVAITSVLDNGSITAAIEAGAIGHLLKNGDAIDLSTAIFAAAAGQVQLTPNATKALLTSIQLPVSDEPLTMVETEIIRLLVLGKSNQEIAAQLNLNESMVKADVNAILKKLNLKSRTQAVLYAYQFGIV